MRLKSRVSDARRSFERGWPIRRAGSATRFHGSEPKGGVVI